MMIDGDVTTVLSSHYPELMKLADYHKMENGLGGNKEEILHGLAEVATKYGTEIGKKHLLIVDKSKNPKVKK